MNAPGQDPAPGAAAGPGLSWCFEMDFEQLRQALDNPPPWARPARPAAPASDAGDGSDGSDGSAPGGGGAGAPAGADSSHGDARPGPVGGAEPSGRDGGAELPSGGDEVPDPLEGEAIALSVVAGRVAEALPPGPDLAAWLALASSGDVEPGAMPGIAASYRRLAAWAQAGELATIAEMAADAAAADDKIGCLADGRPARVSLSVATEVALALTMSQYGATGWADLAVTLRWRLAATGKALAAGQIDLPRARLIAEATSVLSEDTARAVEARVLPAAGQQTRGQLQAALRLAVIAADPQGAERRRQEAERRATVGLYPDAEGTATLAGHNLPGVHAAAAMARINALARALKAAGDHGGIGLLRAQVMLGLLLGTLPYIPPADGDPGTPPPGDPGDDGPDIPPPGGGSGSGSHGDGTPPGGSGDSTRPGGPDVAPGGGEPGVACGPGGADQGPWQGQPCPADQDAPPDDGLPPQAGAPPDRYYPGDDDPGDAFDGEQPGPWAGKIMPAPHWPPLPAPGQAGPVPPGLRPAGPGAAGPGAAGPGAAGPGAAGPGAAGPGNAWLDGAAGLADGLDLTVPWPVLAGQASRPALLARLGPITAQQACHAAAAAAADPATQWRVILTDPAGHAIAVTRIPPPRHTRASPPDGGARGSPAARASPVYGGARAGRVTITITTRTASGPPPHDHTAYRGILTRALTTARKTAHQAAAHAAADHAAAGCAHTAATSGYRPAPRLRDYITARDLTCRMPICRQPAWRGDLDHTIPYHRGGPTCRCNLGGRCRTHHIVKSLPGWQLHQTQPGTFQWTTPTGRTYLTTPDPYPT
jgi:Domain of unknown function (DUF222)